MKPQFPLKRFLIITLALAFSASAVTYAQSTGTLAPAGIQNPAQTPVSDPSLDSADPAKIRLQKISGNVFHKKNADSDFARVSGDVTLEEGDTLKTEDGVFELVAGNDILNVGPNTTLVINQALVDKAQKTTHTKLNLESGRLKAKVKHLSKGSTFEITTPTAVAAVRGTVLYVFAGNNGGQPFTELFVDDSKKGVVFHNRMNDQSFLVHESHSSTSHGDGSVTPPAELTPEQKQAFLQNWESAFQEVIQQFGVEEIVVLTSPASILAPASGADLLRDNSEFIERLNTFRIQTLATIPATVTPKSEEITHPVEIAKKADGVDSNWNYESANQNKDYGVVSDLRTLVVADNEPEEEGSGVASGEIMRLLANRVPADSEDLEGDINSVLEDYGFGELPEGSAATFVNAHAAAIEVLREAERQTMEREIARKMIAGEIDDLREENQFERADAILTRIADAQTGKVFKDIHGNRVRTDAYVFNNGDNEAQFLYLTLRADGPNAGVSSASIGAKFNTTLPENLRDLPWDDYLRVVNEYQYSLDNELVQGGAPIQHNNMIVHSGDATIYPTQFYAVFQNPNQDSVRFEESYGNPFSMVGSLEGNTFYTGNSERAYFIQRLTDSRLTVRMGEQSWTREGVNISDVLVAGSNPNHINANGIRLDDNHILSGAYFLADNDGNIDDDNNFTVQGIRSLLTGPSNRNIEVIWNFGYGPSMADGDLNQDGAVNLQDMAMLLPYLNVKGPASLEQGDLNGDGRVTLADVFIYANNFGRSYSELFSIDAIITPEVMQPFTSRNEDPLPTSSSQPE